MTNAIERIEKEVQEKRQSNRDKLLYVNDMFNHMPFESDKLDTVIAYNEIKAGVKQLLNSDLEYTDLSCVSVATLYMIDNMPTSEDAYRRVRSAIRNYSLKSLYGAILDSLSTSIY